MASPRSPCQHPLPLGGVGTVVPLDPRADQQRARQAQRGRVKGEPTHWVSDLGPRGRAPGHTATIFGLSKGGTEEGAGELDSDLGPHTTPFSSARMDGGQHLPAFASEETQKLGTPSQRKAASIKTRFY